MIINHPILSVINFNLTILCRMLGNLVVTVSYRPRRVVNNELDAYIKACSPNWPRLHVSRVFDAETIDIFDVLNYIFDNAVGLCSSRGSEISEVSIEIGTTEMRGALACLVDVAYLMDSIGLTKEEFLDKFVSNMFESVANSMMTHPLIGHADYIERLKKMSSYMDESVKDDPQVSDDFDAFFNELRKNSGNINDTVSIVIGDIISFDDDSTGGFVLSAIADEFAPCVEVYELDPKYADPNEALRLFEILDTAYLERIGSFAGQLNEVYPEDARQIAGVKGIIALASGHGKPLQFSLSYTENSEFNSDTAMWDLSLSMRGIEGVKVRTLDIDSSKRYAVLLSNINERLISQYAECLCTHTFAGGKLNYDEAVFILNNIALNNSPFTFDFDSEEKAVVFARCLDKIADSLKKMDTSWSYDYHVYGPVDFSEHMAMIGLIKMRRTFSGEGLRDAKLFVEKLGLDAVPLGSEVVLVQHWDEADLCTCDDKYVMSGIKTGVQGSHISGPYFYW